MSDKYYRGLRNILNDTKHKLQLASMTLKINENKNSISEIKNDISGINNFSDKINDNETNISDNLVKINDNSSDISSNLGKINNNETNISTNLGKIDDFTQYILQSGKDFEEKYTIEKQIFRFNKDKHFYTLFEKEIEYNFTKNSLLFVKNNMYYKYDNLSNDYYRLQHEYNIYDENDLIHKYLFNKDTYFDESLDPILHTSEDFCICFKKNYNKIKINLQLHRHNRHGTGNINLEIDDDNENYINIDYVDRNNEERINKNKNDISTNLIKINSNEDDILTNLNEINYLKKNISKSYLKNLYTFIPFYDHDDYDPDAEKNRIPVNRLFFTKTFKMNIKKNDFIELNLRMFLEYEKLDDAHIVDTLIKFFDDDERIYFIKYRNGNFLAYGKYVFLNNNIIYHFEKDTENLKKEIRFEYNSKVFSLGVKKIWHVSRNTTDQWILKHYGN